MIEYPHPLCKWDVTNLDVTAFSIMERERGMMFEKSLCAAAVAVFLSAAYAQVSSSFEVASVKASPLAARGGEGSTRDAIQFTPTTLSMQNVTLRSCIRWAYDVKEFQLVGPDWLTADRYDITAKTSESVPIERLRLMLQTLLAERFKLSTHRERKEVSVYALRTTSRRPELHVSTSSESASMRPSGGALEFHNMSMTELAERLPKRPFGIGRPVIDETALKGAFDFTMKLAGNAAELKSDLERRETDQDASFFVAPLRELGLRLQSEKAPVEMLVVDHAERKPVEN
jgi:uncharacterized protein (TIGR03435 family)